MAAEQESEVRPLLTDLYQVTMALGYWRAGRAQDQAEFELFFRRCPFGGAFALAAGLRDCLRFLRAFRFRDEGTLCAQGLSSPKPPIPKTVPLKVLPPPGLRKDTYTRAGPWMCLEPSVFLRTPSQGRVPPTP